MPQSHRQIRSVAILRSCENREIPEICAARCRSVQKNAEQSHRNRTYDLHTRKIEIFDKLATILAELVATFIRCCTSLLRVFPEPTLGNISFGSRNKLACSQPIYIRSDPSLISVSTDLVRVSYNLWQIYNRVSYVLIRPHPSYIRCTKDAHTTSPDLSRSLHTSPDLLR